MNTKRFAASADSETDENIWETVEDAYVYAFPLMLMDAAETSATNTEEARICLSCTGSSCRGILVCDCTGEYHKLASCR